MKVIENQALKDEGKMELQKSNSKKLSTLQKRQTGEVAEEVARKLVIIEETWRAQRSDDWQSPLPIDG